MSESGRISQSSSIDEAGKFHRPVITFIESHSRSFCGIGAEERGQGEALARNQMEMSRLASIISIFIGEGGSGGALASPLLIGYGC